MQTRGGGGLLFGMGFSRLRPLGFFSRLVMQTRGGGGGLLEIKTAGLLFEISCANSWGDFFPRWASSRD